MVESCYRHRINMHHMRSNSSLHDEVTTYLPPTCRFKCWGHTTRFPTRSFFFFLSFSVSSQCAGSKVKPLTEDRGCDSVMLGQSNRTPHGAVIDEYGAMVEWYLQGKPKYSEKTCPVPLCPPQTPHGLTPARTRASAVKGQRLTAWAMARPTRSFYCF
jgi:hypothetical protein